MTNCLKDWSQSTAVAKLSSLNQVQFSLDKYILAIYLSVGNSKILLFPLSPDFDLNRRSVN